MMFPTLILFSTYSVLTLSAHSSQPSASDACATINATDLALAEGELVERACHPLSKAYGCDGGYC